MGEPCHDERIEKIEHTLYGDSKNMGALHQIKLAREMIESHVQECRETRKEQRDRDEAKRINDRNWYMGIIGTIIAAVVISMILAKNGVA